MSHPQPRRATAALLVIIFIAGTSWLTIFRHRAPKPPTPAATTTPATTYTLRGRIEQLPDPAVKGSTLQIHHESIPTFTDQTGKVIGMNEMIMPFPPAPSLLLDGLAVGDNIEFTFEVAWGRIPPQHATKIAKLPPDQKPAISDNK